MDVPKYSIESTKEIAKPPISTLKHLLWTPAQRKRASMLYFANVFFFNFFMAALFSGPG